MKNDTKQARSIRKKEQTRINTLKKNAIKKEKSDIKSAIALVEKEKRDKEIAEMKILCPSGRAICAFPKF